MSHSTTMTIRLEPELKSRLDKLSAATRRSKSFLAAEAVREFVEINEWQIQETENAIKEADAGDFSSDQELQAVLNKWGIDGD
ncbi:MAG: CopG family ribbon-helix-helix protein [Gammaproteobacteria bacterium]|nr:CopG family ribbon-helix-helix protein [Gammaproteobacteria bacterium]